MKRLNPKTGQPFKRGDVREDGYVFSTYQKSVIRSDGTFKECWLRPDRLEAQREVSSRCGVVIQRRKRKATLEWVNAYKTEKGCEVCGYNVHPAALDFDHIDRTMKSFDVSQVLGSKSDDAVRAEIVKCRVLCANCHRIKTYENEDFRRKHDA